MQQEPRLNSFPLQRLHKDLQHRIIEKLTFLSWCRLLLGSSNSYRLCSEIRHRLPFGDDNYVIYEPGFFRIGGEHIRHDWDDPSAMQIAAEFPCKLHLDFFNVMDSLNSSAVEEIIRICSKSEITARELFIDERIKCDEEELAELLKVLEVKSLDYQFKIRDSSFFNIPYIMNMEKLKLDMCEMNEKQFLNLKVKSLSINGDQISGAVINRILKDVLSKKRDLFFFTMKFSNTANISRHADILEDLHANPLWTPEFHDYSLISSIPLNDLQPRYTSADPTLKYILWHFSNIKVVYRLDISKDHLFFQRVSDYDLAFDNFFHLI